MTPTEDGDAPSSLRLTLIILSVVALLGIFGTVFFYGKYHHLRARDSEASAVKAASTQFLEALTNFNANTVDASFNQIQSMATGDFAKQAQTTFSSDIRAALAKVQATSRGQIRFLYVESIDSSTAATTFAEIDQTIANLRFSHPEQDVLRVALNLEKHSGAWKIALVTVLQGPATVVPSADATPSTSTSTTAPPTGK